MSDSLWPQGLYSVRLLCTWDSPRRQKMGVSSRKKAWHIQRSKQGKEHEPEGWPDQSLKSKVVGELGWRIDEIKGLSRIKSCKVFWASLRILKYSLRKGQRRVVYSKIHLKDTTLATWRELVRTLKHSERPVRS